MIWAQQNTLYLHHSLTRRFKQKGATRQVCPYACSSALLSVRTSNIRRRGHHGWRWGRSTANCYHHINSRGWRRRRRRGSHGQSQLPATNRFTPKPLEQDPASVLVAIPVLFWRLSNPAANSQNKVHWPFSMQQKHCLRIFDRTAGQLIEV